MADIVIELEPVTRQSKESAVSMAVYDLDPVTSTAADLSATEAPSYAVSLPPMDYGFDAWAYLASAFIIELLVWSYPFSYGVFLNWYTSNTFKDKPAALLPLVGSLSTGIMYLSSVIILPIISRFPRQKKNVMAFGLVLCVIGLVGAAFSRKMWHLILTQGVIYSFGGSLLYFPAMSFLFEWFSIKKGLANGIIYSGTAVGGVVVPFAVEALLHKYGQKTTFLSLAAAFALLTVPTFPYIKSRLPPAQHTAVKTVDVKFLSYAPFWVLFLSNLVQGLANFIPNLYIPTFVRDLKLSDTSGAIVLSLLNGASAPGLIFLGWSTDRHDLRITITISALGSSLAVLLIWGLSGGLAPLLIFACVYGFLAPSWSALWPRFVSTVAGDDPHQSLTLMSIFIAGRGIGNVLSAPISSGLLHPWALTDHSSFAYGLKGYGPLITFTGVTLFTSSLGITYRSFENTNLNLTPGSQRRWEAHV